MKLSKMPKEELELYSYIDLTKMVLEEAKKPLNTPDLFKKLCKLLGLSEEDYMDKIGDYYTSLTTDKDFVLLEDATWDLRDHHPVNVVLEDDDTEEEIEEEIEDDEPIEDDLSDGDEEDSMDDIDDEDDEELTIISEEELDD